jgi:AcrR family transcriptional regulator
VVKALSREEAKLITRRRLLESAAKTLGETGYGGLSVSAVTRAAGVAQPTFYVHFRDKDDLLQTLAAEKFNALRAKLREARERVRAGHGVEAVRDTFRLPLQTFLSQPALFRLYLQEARQPGSPIGEQSRRLRDELRDDLTEDLIGLGMLTVTEGDRKQVEMIAEAMIAQTEALGLGYLDGRYDDVDTIAEVLTRFAVGILGLK